MEIVSKGVCASQCKTTVERRTAVGRCRADDIDAHDKPLAADRVDRGGKIFKFTCDGEVGCVYAETLGERLCRIIRFAYRMGGGPELRCRH